MASNLSQWVANRPHVWTQGSSMHLSRPSWAEDSEAPAQLKFAQGKTSVVMENNMKMGPFSLSFPRGTRRHSTKWPKVPVLTAIDSEDFKAPLCVHRLLEYRAHFWVSCTISQSKALLWQQKAAKAMDSGSRETCKLLPNIHTMLLSHGNPIIGNRESDSNWYDV